MISSSFILLYGHNIYNIFDSKVVLNKTSSENKQIFVFSVDSTIDIIYVFNTSNLYHPIEYDMHQRIKNCKNMLISRFFFLYNVKINYMKYIEARTIV